MASMDLQTITGDLNRRQKESPVMAVISESTLLLQLYFEMFCVA